VVSVALVESWEDELEDLFARVAGRFSRVEPRKRAFAYARGLLAPLERRNGWTLAEQAGDRSPDAMQALLTSPAWDPDAVRDDVRDYVVARIGDPAGVLIADETGFVKKGTRSAGVQRQYSGTAGRTENCQIGTFLCYATDMGRALIDRELYVPQSWTSDRVRCRAAAIPDEVAFATKPQQARTMLQRALAAGVPFRWFTADEAYGQNPGLRDWLEEQTIPYVMATRRDDEVACGLHTRTRVDHLIAKLPVRGPGCPAGTARTVPAATTGRGWRSVGPTRTVGGAGCWPAAASATLPRSPTTCVSVPEAPGCGNWSWSPVPDGRSRNRSRPRRMRSASTSTRSAATTPGTRTSPWP
jgi:hypothetical protein